MCADNTECGYPGRPLGSIVDITGQVATYSCSEGSVLQGDARLYCHQGEWSGVVPTCAGVQCPDPASPRSGYIEVSNFAGKYEAGSIASYRCNTGHLLWGNSTR